MIVYVRVQACSLRGEVLVRYQSIFIKIKKKETGNFFSLITQFISDRFVIMLLFFFSLKGRFLNTCLFVHVVTDTLTRVRGYFKTTSSMWPSDRQEKQ